MIDAFKTGEHIEIIANGMVYEGRQQHMLITPSHAVELHRQLGKLLYPKAYAKPGNYVCGSCGLAVAVVSSARGCECGGIFGAVSSTALELDGEWTAEMAAECRRSAARR